jgi:hypothetical protein
MGATQTYAGGCLTMLSLVVAFLLAALVMMVDCVSGPSYCPTGDERKLLLLGILIVTVGSNVLLWWALARRPKG